MSKAVPVLSDRSTHDIRNAVRGDGLFAPHPLIVSAFMFIIATASRRYNVGIVAYALMPNHIHLIIRPFFDPDKPSDPVLFRRFVRSNFGRFINFFWQQRGLDTRGAVFCYDSTGDSIMIIDAESEIDQIRYVELNGVRAGLETRPEYLKGAISQRRWLTNPPTVERPKVWFQRRSWEESEVLRLCVPPKAEEKGHDARSFQEKSQEIINQSIRKEHARRKSAGLGFRRLSDIAKDVPAMEFGHSEADYSRAVLVGADKQLKALEFHNLRAWNSWYDDAKRRLKAGETNVVFPPGTYQLAALHGVQVADESYFRAPIRRRDAGNLGQLYRRQLM